MTPTLKWTLRVGGALLGLLALALATVYALSSLRFRRTWAIAPAPVRVPTGSCAVRRGAHVALIRGCRACHGDDLGGKVFFDEPILGRLWASNLTTGRGGVGSAYRTEDWVRAIRHGVAPDGRSLFFMPAQDLAQMGDEDLGTLLAWVRSLPPRDNEPAVRNIVGPLGRILYLAGRLPLVPAERIEHRTGPITAPVRGPTVEYGRYLATSCRGCHGDDFSGGSMPGSPPSTATAANLTPDASGLGAWTEADFFRALRSGVRPDGRVMDPTAMPWPTFGQMTDEEIRAVWRFLRSLSPLKTGD